MAASTRDLPLAPVPAGAGELYENLETELRPRLQAISRLRSYAAGRTILASASEAAFAGTIVAGVVRLIRHDVDGRGQLVGFMVRSDVFGHPHARHGTFSTEAATAVTICQFERAAFATLVQQSPLLQQYLISRTLDELDGAREWLSLLGCRNAMERVASFLLILLRSRSSRASGGERGIVFGLTIPVSRTDLASYLGLTPETVSRCIHRLADRNTIRIVKPNRFEVRDMRALIQAAGGKTELPAGPVFVRMSEAFAA